MKTNRKIISHKKKLSRRKDKGSDVRKKYNSRLKKNITRKRSVLKGGANTIPTQTGMPQTSPPKYIPPHKREQKIDETTPLEEYKFVLEQSKLYYIPSQSFKEITYYNGETIKVYYNTSFKKYVFKNGNIYYVYTNTSKPDEPIIYSVFESTNQSITIDTDINLEHTITITPLELSVDTMQLAINTGSLQIIEPTLMTPTKTNNTNPYKSFTKNSKDETDKHDNNMYLGFVNFPSLVVNKVSHSYKSSRKHAIWLNVYEDEGSFTHNLTEPYKYEYHTNYQDKLTRERQYEQITFSNNAEYFNEMKTKIKAKMLEIKTNSNDKLKLELELKLEDLFKRICFGRFVKKEEDNTILQQIDGLEWLMRNTLWLENYLELKKEAGYKDQKLLASELSSLIDKKYECDLSGLDEKYIIVDEFVNTGDGDGSGDGETYVICGYPDKKMKEIVLNFWQEKENTEENKTHNDIVKGLNSNHLFQQDKNSEFFLKLFEKYKPIKLENHTYNEGDLYMSLREGIFDYIEKRYAELYSSYSPDDPEYKIYKDYFTYPSNGKLNKFREDAHKYFQKIGQKYVHKPITQITYVFLAFKQNKTTDLLEPFIFNIKELKKEHQPILKRIERLIKYELPTKFGILKSDEKDKFPEFDDEYKLWYSRYRYGKFFHIETEYLHTMSNIADKAHNYKNSITLEELIYSCGLDYEPNSIQLKSNVDNTSFFEHLRIEYEIREYNLESTRLKMSKSSKSSNNKNTSKNSNCEIIENRSEKVFCLYEKDKLLKEKGKEKQNNKTEAKILSLNEKELVKDHFGNIINIKKIQFILVFKTNRQEYTFIYCYNDEFYKLVIESNVSKILDSVIIELNKNIKANGINFSQINKGFKIVSIDKLDDKTLKFIFTINLLILMNIKQIPNETDLSYYYETALLIPKQLGNIKNLYLKMKPYIYENNIFGEEYIKRLQKYLDNLKNSQPVNLDCNTLTYEEKFVGCSIRKCIPFEVIINCSYYNIGNSGYNIIESIDNTDNKIILYIVPYNYNKKNNLPKYLGNFLDLDETSLSILNEIKNKYCNNDYLCFLHTTMQFKFYCIHFHIIKKDYYKRVYPIYDSGVYMTQDMFIDEVINNLKCSNNYYKRLNYNLIKKD